MNWLALYHLLPYPARCLAADWRGWQLRRQRYGPDTPRLLAATLERDRWDAETWRRHHAEALTTLLERAVERVPWYRDLWRGRDGWQALESWPILRKETLRRDPRAFLADDSPPRRLVQEHTSGSTGTPLTLWTSRATARAWYALHDARLLAWHGLTRGDRRALLGGQLVAPVQQSRPPFWVWSSTLRQLYLSVYHLEPAHAAAYIDALGRHRVRYLLGYPSALAILARYAREQGLAVPRMRVVLANAEPLLDAQREVLEEVFDGPVRETWGTAEKVAGASECEAGTLHLWPDAGIVEVLDDDDRPLPVGETGRLVVTGLLRHDQPLIRYEIGDRGALGPTGCPCGRTLPVLQTVEGRLDDVILTPEGRRVGRLDPVFKGELPIREAQIVQETRQRVVLRLVPAPGFTPAHAAQLEERLRQRLGPSIEIEVEEVECLERGPRGKLRSVVSKLGDGAPV